MNQDEEFKENTIADQNGAAEAELSVQYSERLAAGLLEQIKYSKSLEELNKKLRLELSTLRFKESQEQRFIWWIYQVYSRNVCDLIYEIMGATTYDTEGEAKEGKYSLPKHCFDLLKRLDEYTEHIYDGTYLDIEVSTENKTVPENKTSTDNNKLDIHTLEYAAKWIENSLVGETNERVIEFGKNMAMSILAAKPSPSDVSVTQDIKKEQK